LRVHKLILIVYLHSYVVQRIPVLGLLNDSICSLTEDLPEAVIGYLGIIKGSIFVGLTCISLYSIQIWDPVILRDTNR
jgi:hypothetical protein